MTKRILIVENHENCPYQDYVSELGGFICSLIYNEKKRIVCCHQEHDFHVECPLVKLDSCKDCKKEVLCALIGQFLPKDGNCPEYEVKRE